MKYYNNTKHQVTGVIDLESFSQTYQKIERFSPSNVHVSRTTLLAWNTPPPPNFVTVSSKIVLEDLAMAFAGGLWQSNHTGTQVSAAWMDILL